MYKYLHHISDFMVATAHLSPVEECFYRRALDFYYLNEKPLPKETQSVFRRLRANTQEERDAVLIVLQEFFVEEEDGFHNKRCDSEIAAYQKVGDKNRENGKKGGRPRKEKPKENQSEGDSVNSENPQKPSGLILGSESESQKNLNHKPLTDNQYIDSSSNARGENSQLTPEAGKEVQKSKSYIRCEISDYEADQIQALLRSLLNSDKTDFTTKFALICLIKIKVENKGLLKVAQETNQSKAQVAIMVSCARFYLLGHDKRLRQNGGSNENIHCKTI